MTQEALKLALEALKTIDEAMPFPVAKLAQAAIKEALAKSEQEPVAWLSTDSIGERHLCFDKPLDNDPVQPLYTTPPNPEQEPVAHLWECLGRWAAYLVNNGKQAERVPPSWLVDAIKKATIPPQQEQKLIGTVGDLFDDRVIANRKLDRDLLVYTAAP